MEFRESDLQRVVIEKIQNGEFWEAIGGKDEVKKIADLNDSETLPHFSIDQVVRTSVARGASRVLESLFEPRLLLEDRNISISTGELLRPDIICLDEGTETLVLFELKKSDQTGRQALTELLAYEQEIKNILPFLADYDTALVLISTEWSTLMDHAAAGAVVWSGKNLLCLEATVGSAESSFRIRIPNAWYITGSVYLPPDSVSCITICLYDYAVSSQDSSWENVPTLDQRIPAALEVIAREGDRIGSHGFAILWKDCWTGTQSLLNITVGVISPFAFYKTIRASGTIQDEVGGLIPKLDEFISEDSITGHSKTLMNLASSVKPMLSSICTPMIEGLTEWSLQRTDMMTRALPLSADFWGLPGKFIRDYWSHPAVIKHKFHWVRPEIRDWHDPSVAIPLLSAFFAPTAFVDGAVRCSDAFQLGVALGLDIHLRRTLKRASGEMARKLRCRIVWAYLELKNLLEEVRLISDAARNVGNPKKPFELHSDPDFDNEENSQHLIAWIAEEFLCSEPLVIGAFQIGLNGAPLFDQALAASIGDGPGNEFLSFIREDASKLGDAIVNSAKDAWLEGTIERGSERVARRLLENLGLTFETAAGEDFTNAVLKLDRPGLCDFLLKVLVLGDLVVPRVFHELVPVKPKRVDWEWLRQGIREMRERGEQYPAVQILASGELSTGPLHMPALQAMTPIKDPEEEVLFSDSSSGVCVVIHTTWAELMRGEHFPVLNNEPRDEHARDESDE
jgi:hypothetical protein